MNPIDPRAQSAQNPELNTLAGALPRTIIIPVLDELGRAAKSSPANATA
jgi:hypothetical protein